MSDFDKKLKQMNKDWKEGKDAPPGAPDGTYAMQLQAVGIREAESSGNLYVNREHLITDGEHEGSVLYDMLSLATERGPYFVARFIDQMGYEAPENIADLPETLEAIQNDAPCYMGTVKHNGDFINVRIGEVTGATEEETKPKARTAPKKKGDPDPGPTADQKEQVEEGKIPLGTKVKFTDAKEGEIAGTIIDNDDPENHHVEDPNGDPWGVPANECEIIEGVEPDADGDIPGTGEEPSDELIELIALAQACDMAEVTADDDLEAVVEKLGAYTWEADQLTDDEIALLKNNKIKVN